MTSFELTAASLHVRARELRDWRTGGHDLPSGLASTLLDTERLLTDTAAKFDTVTAIADGDPKAALVRVAELSQERRTGGWPLLSGKLILHTIGSDAPYDNGE